jgi:hypothetical protein
MTPLLMRVVQSPTLGRRRPRTPEFATRLRTQPRERKLSVEDRASIEALLTEYAWLIDHDRSHELQQLCTSDAVIIAPAARKARRTRHQITNVRIKDDGPDTATATSTLVLHVLKHGRRDTFVDMVGEFHDELVRTASGWRFTRRRLVHIADA